MQHSDLLTQIAKLSDNQMVIGALFTLPDTSLSYALADNPHLTIAQRTHLLKKSPVALARKLATCAVGDEAIAQILQDPRNTVKSELFRDGLKQASDNLVSSLLPDLLKEDLQSSQSNLSHWLSSKNPPNRELTRELASKTHISVQLQLLADTTLYTPSEVLALLTSLQIPSYQNIAPILDTYPQLLPDILEAMRGNLPHKIDKGVLFSALTASRHIFGQETFVEIARYCAKLRKPLAIRTLMLLSENPNLAPETLRVVAKAVTHFHGPTGAALDSKLAHRLKHALPYVTQDWSLILNTPSGQLPTEKAAIISFANKSFYWNYPTLEQDLTAITASTTPPKDANASPIPLTRLLIKPTRAATALPKSKTLPTQTLDYDAFNTRVLPSLLPHGPTAIEIFLSLCPDWQSNVQELLDTTLASLS